MAREIKELLWCDRHRGLHVEDVEGETQVIRINGTEFESEMCVDCQTELVEPLLDALAEYGRTVKGRRRSNVRHLPTRIAAASESEGLLSTTKDADTMVACPKDGCGKEVKLSSLGSHCRGQHNQSLYEVQEETGIHIIKARRSPSSVKKTAKRRRS